MKSRLKTQNRNFKTLLRSFTYRFTTPQKRSFFQWVYVVMANIQAYTPWVLSSIPTVDGSFVMTLLSSYVTRNPLCGFSCHTPFEVSTLASLCVTPDQCQWMCLGGMLTQFSDLSRNQIEPRVSFLLRSFTNRFKAWNSEQHLYVLEFQLVCNLPC